MSMIAIPGLVFACSTPVFDFALQHWAPDSYGIQASHSAEPSGDEAAAIELLTESAAGANISNSFSIASDAPPTITVSYPRSARIQKPVWQAPLTLKSVEKVVGSPVRKMLVEEIAAGRCAVWLFLESGNKELDDAAEQRLRASLTELEKTLLLPERPDTDEAEGIAPTNAARKASFAVIRLSRNDPAESFLVSNLLNSESDLHEFAEPMAFPVFGRGRALYAIVGKGINADIVERASVFVTGSCSCEVKSGNPGVDLLISANWNDVLTKFEYKEDALPPLTGIASGVPVASAPVAVEDAIASDAGGNTAKNTIIALAGLAALVFIGSLIVLWRAKKSQ
ncbi:MAG: hypothetical protein QGH42_10950 [Kiritimatiellia bacterium]|nr:hypothetical protein [Kiritimatiellia bacterium]